jgi:hypothetical protein
MKTITCLSIFLLLSVSAIKAQQYFPFVEESKIWSELNMFMEYIPPYPLTLTTMSFKLEGDTSWNGLTYKNLYTCDSDPTTSDWTIGSDYLYREEAGKVLRVNLWSVQEEVVYDFNLNVGDSIYVDSAYTHAYAHVTLVDSIIIDGAYHKQIHFDSPTDIWVEGLGSLHSPFNPIQYAFIYPTGFQLLCVTNQNGNIYMNPSYHQCYIDTTYITGLPIQSPSKSKLVVISNPMHAFSQVKIEGKPDQFEKFVLFNSRGNIIKIGSIKDNTFILKRDNLPSGIYILKVYSKQDVLTNKLIMY